MSDTERLLWICGFIAVATFLFSYVLAWRAARKRRPTPESLAKRNQETRERFEQAQHKKWEGHFREDVFKRKHHRWDPWLERLGYFKKR
jgi:hypothetical protein